MVIIGSILYFQTNPNMVKYWWMVYRGETLFFFVVHSGDEPLEVLRGQPRKMIESWSMNGAFSTSIWVNDLISPTWILRPFGDDVPNPNHDSRVRENSEVAIIYADLYMLEEIEEELVGGIPTHLKNDGVRELGWWHSIPVWKVIKFHGSSHHQPK